MAFSESEFPGLEDIGTRAEERYREQAIALWLFGIAAMIFAMVVLGGVTRLTESGLSIVDWRPATGWLPPLSEAEWQRIFADYQKYPEFRKLNSSMDLAGFKEIFWLEYLHRLWGRLIGLAFAVPFVVFAARGWVSWRLAPRLVVMFALGGAQGVLGWWMVKSGMVDHPEVSQYRLTAHLGLALAVFVYVLWTALGLWRGSADLPRRRVPAGWAVLGLVFVTILAGGFVAGLDAGYGWNSWPLMDGALVPGHLIYTADGWATNLFEDPASVQFNHRLLALVTLAAVLAFGWKAGSGMGRAAMAMVILQVGLGIATLLSVVWLPLAALHQAGAVVLLGLVVVTLQWAVFPDR
ncbi:MAG: COX15/CtaA family protein [Rhodospirillales bacterium]